MSDNIFKANRISIHKDDKKVIDSNDAVNERLVLLAEILERQASGPSEEDFTPGFIEGLDAAQVEMLLADPEEGFDGEFTEGLDAFQGGNMSEALANANSQIQQMLDDAQAQADEIINSAREQAQAIIDEAAGEIENMKAQAAQEGYEQGFSQGHEEGVQKAAQLEEELKARAQQMDIDFENRINELEPLFIDNLTDIYSHIFNVDLSGYRNVVIHLIRNAIRSIDGTKSYFVHVSTDDYKEVSEAKEELEAGLGSQANVEIIEDMTLKQSECFIEAESGIFDCSLGTELELLKKELVLLSFQKEN